MRDDLLRWIAERRATYQRELHPDRRKAPRRMYLDGLVLLDVALAAVEAGPWPIVNDDGSMGFRCVHCHAADYVQAEIDHDPSCPGVRLATLLSQITPPDAEGAVEAPEGRVTHE